MAVKRRTPRRAAARSMTNGASHDTMMTATSNTIKYSTRFWKQIKMLASTRNTNMRQLIRDIVKAEIEHAKAHGEVAGDLFDGKIGEDPFDLHLPPSQRPRVPA